jgi:chemotaxis protein methyltransferase CheR
MVNISRVSDAAAFGSTAMQPLFATNLSARDAQMLVDLVYQHSHIRLGPDKQLMLTNRLRRRLRSLGLSSYEDYCALLRSKAGGDEIEQLIDVISTNHTGFFREPDHFAFLADYVLPKLLPALAAAACPFRAWSAAAASGEESYTMAVVLAEFFRGYPSMDWELDASDISHQMMEQAERGIYKLDAQHTLPLELLRRYFERGVGPRAGMLRVKAELRRRVRFHRINLFQPEYPVPREQHVIFCRNVMIYFDPGSRATLLGKLTRHLAPGGFLFIGHSESLMGIQHNLEPIRQSVYRKP